MLICSVVSLTQDSLLSSKCPMISAIRKVTNKQKRITDAPLKYSLSSLKLTLGWAYSIWLVKILYRLYRNLIWLSNWLLDTLKLSCLAGSSIFFRQIIRKLLTIII